MPDPDTTTETARASDRVTAAFARVADARYAIGILETCGMDPLSITLETVQDERGGVSIVILRVAIDGLARDRVLAAISGGHGVPMPEPRIVAEPTPVDTVHHAAPLVRVA